MRLPLSHDLHHHSHSLVRADLQFAEHNGDVMSIATSPVSPNIFVTGACDAFAKVWDVKQPGAPRTFSGHESDINAVTFFGDGQAFTTGAATPP